YTSSLPLRCVSSYILPPSRALSLSPRSPTSLARRSARPTPRACISPSASLSAHTSSSALVSTISLGDGLREWDCVMETRSPMSVLWMPWVWFGEVEPVCGGELGCVCVWDWVCDLSASALALALAEENWDGGLSVGVGFVLGLWDMVVLLWFCYLYRNCAW
ncbi:hypothetical protein C7974DRAFT_438831, partial [Boeremia exigua]|uniref:uncharacterized protein n=1 Tax=Boeremia exigua TaxID=749465 RepID=UPI001E8EA5A8